MLLWELSAAADNGQPDHQPAGIFFEYFIVFVEIVKDLNGKKKNKREITMIKSIISQYGLFALFVSQRRGAQIFLESKLISHFFVYANE